MTLLEMQQECDPVGASAPADFTHDTVGYTNVEAILATNYDPRPTYLIDEILPLGLLIPVAGDAGVGKSFAFSFTAGLAIATGTPVLGYDVPKPARVLVFDQENSRPDYAQYLRWAWHGLGKPDMALVKENFYHAPFVLGKASWSAEAEARVRDIHPEFIVFDTATTTFATEDENDNAEAARIVNKIRGIQHQITPHPTIVVLMHAKIYRDNGDYTIRGAKYWLGATDGTLYLKRGEGAARNDGLTNTTLVSGKTRAFGLRKAIHLHPEWLGDEKDAKAGLRLNVGK